jgi:hypothetical protein
LALRQQAMSRRLNVMSVKIPSYEAYFKQQKNAGTSDCNKDVFHSKHKEKLKKH